MIQDKSWRGEIGYVPPSMLKVGFGRGAWKGVGRVMDDGDRERVG